jgi:hypothetical protein
VPDPQPYRQLAEVLKKQGHEEDARTVLRVCAERRMKPLWRRARREGASDPPMYLASIGAVGVVLWLLFLMAGHLWWAWVILGSMVAAVPVIGVMSLRKDGLRRLTGRLEGCRVWVTQWCYCLLVGHGYARWRAAFWAFVMFALGAIVFNVKSDVNMQPAQAVALRAWTFQSAPGTNPAQALDTAWVRRYPKFDPVVYSLDTLLPLVSFHQEDHWTPSGRGQSWGISWWGWFVKNIYLPLHIAAGWVIATLFVASFTRLMRSEG